MLQYTQSITQKRTKFSLSIIMGCEAFSLNSFRERLNRFKFTLDCIRCILKSTEEKKNMFPFLNAALNGPSILNPVVNNTYNHINRKNIFFLRSQSTSK